MIMVAGLTASLNVQAAQFWSACQTIVGITNDQAYNNTLVLALSPGISGCGSSSIPGSMQFVIGTDGVTAANFNGVLASTLSAYATGAQVMIYYDTSVTNCAGVILSIGGYSGQCP
jgi:basic membrane lipoprotein Med (substrate-binding protein (PBP1-ABC) superfamily)